MFKTLVCLVACSMGAGTVVKAHHSYAEYDREHTVAVEGTIDQVTLANPHAILMVRADDGTVFTAEWGSAVQLDRWGVRAGMLAIGDRVVVTGSAFRDPAVHRLSLLTEIVRPRDGWRWSRNRNVETPAGVTR